MQTQKQPANTTENKTESKTESKTEEQTLSLGQAESLAAAKALEYTIADITTAAQSYRRSTLRKALAARLTPPKAS